MLCDKNILRLIACAMTLEIVCAISHKGFVDDSNSRIFEESENSEYKITSDIYLQSQKSANSYFDGTLARLKRALSELAYEEQADDMELAEINVFRPLFRYRAEFARQVKNAQQQQQFS